MAKGIIRDIQRVRKIVSKEIAMNATSGGKYAAGLASEGQTTMPARAVTVENP